MGYYFVIDVDPTISTVGLGSDSRMVKVFAGQESVYYFRKFKKVNTRFSGGTIESDDYEIYPLAMGRNIYGDDISQIVFNEDINIDGLIDNLG